MPQPKIFSANGTLPVPLAEQPIDLNDQLVKNKAYTFLMRVHSNAMQDAGIQCGDVVLVDRLLEPKNGAVIIAALQGELIIRQYENANGCIRLVPACGQLSPIVLNNAAGFTVWGVVTYVIRQLGSGAETMYPVSG